MRNLIIIVFLGTQFKEIQNFLIFSHFGILPGWPSRAKTLCGDLPPGRCLASCDGLLWLGCAGFLAGHVKVTDSESSKCCTKHQIVVTRCEWAPCLNWTVKIHDFKVLVAFTLAVPAAGSACNLCMQTPLIANCFFRLESGSWILLLPLQLLCKIASDAGMMELPWHF